MAWEIGLEPVRYFQVFNNYFITFGLCKVLSGYIEFVFAQEVEDVLGREDSVIHKTKVGKSWDINK
jgi:hypothetical protein